jgi:hypothetical protein
MAEVLHKYESPLSAEGRVFRSRACGREVEGGRWEGWIEFVPDDGGAVLRSARETTQPNRTGTVYWAEGLSPVYLEGSLERTLRLPVRRPAVPIETAAYPAPHPGPEPGERSSEGPVAPAIVDPFSLYAKGRDLLRDELRALEPWHLRNVIRAYRLDGGAERELDELDRAALVEWIVGGVEARLRAER